MKAMGRRTGCSATQGAASAPARTATVVLTESRGATACRVLLRSDVLCLGSWAGTSLQQDVAQGQDRFVA